jgi:hypothetical protein
MQPQRAALVVMVEAQVPVALVELELLALQALRQVPVVPEVPHMQAE